jgi:hypothetical protein
MKYTLLNSVAVAYYANYSGPFLNQRLEYVSGGNHPDRYWMATQKGACPHDTSITGIYVRGSTMYGTIDRELCLNLENGDIVSLNKYTSPPKKETLVIPPFEKELQFEYVEGLHFMRQGVNLVQNGNPFPPRNIPARPEVAPISEYLSRVSQNTLTLWGAVLKVNVPTFVEYDAEQSIFIDYQCIEDADIIIKQFDSSKVYSETRKAVSAQSLSYVSLTFMTPAQVHDVSTYSVQVGMVPRGKTLDAAFVVKTNHPEFLKRERILWISCSWMSTLGSDLSCYLRTKTVMDRKMELTLIKDGRVLLTETRSSSDDTPWVIRIDRSWEPGVYQVPLTLLGSDSIPLDQQSTDIQIMKE